MGDEKIIYLKMTEGERDNLLSIIEEWYNSPITSAREDDLTYDLHQGRLEKRITNKPTLDMFV